LAKKVKTQAQMKAIGDGLVAFGGENPDELQGNDYPSSAAINDPTVSGTSALDMFGAQRAVRYLLGKDMRGWKWSSLHRIEFSHPFGQEAMLRPIFNYGPFPFEGDEHTINRSGYANEKPFKVNITASIRYIADLSALPESLIVLSSGQSAHLLGRHRTDMCDLFMKGEYIPWYFLPEQYAARTEGTLTFSPE
jgi:acyl-homoserine lactone acylase PvdQ